MSDKIHVIFFSNKPDCSGHKNYIKSLEKYQYNYTCLGIGQKWEGFVNSKIKTCYEYLQTIDDEGTIICVTDVFDILAIESPENLYKKFKKFNLPLVVGVEKVRLHVYPGQEKLSPVSEKRKYFNGGFYMGYLNNIKELFRHVLSLKGKVKEDNDDQYCIGHYIVNNSDLVGRDYKSSIVHNVNISLLPEYKFEKNNGKKRLKVKETGEFPCFLHCPGLLGIQHLNNVTKELFPIDRMEKYSYIQWMKKYKTIYNSVIVVLILLGVIILIGISVRSFRHFSIKKLNQTIQ